MSGSTPSERFVREMTRGQNTLFGFILSLSPNPDAARDILQNTNVVLWQKAGQFTEGTNFLAWAKAAARLEVLAYRRDHARDRLVFDDALLDRLADESGPIDDEPDDRARAFEDCLAGLPSRQRDLISIRYAPRRRSDVLLASPLSDVDKKNKRASQLARPFVSFTAVCVAFSLPEREP